MKWIKKLFAPSSSLSVIALLAIGGGISLAGVLAFDYAMEATSTDQFCGSSCEGRGSRRSFKCFQSV